MSILLPDSLLVRKTTSFPNDEITECWRLKGNRKATGGRNTNPPRGMFIGRPEILSVMNGWQGVACQPISPCGKLDTLETAWARQFAQSSLAVAAIGFPVALYTLYNGIS